MAAKQKTYREQKRPPCNQVENSVAAAAATGVLHWVSSVRYTAEYFLAARRECGRERKLLFLFTSEQTVASLCLTSAAAEHKSGNGKSVEI